jgi:hypothetical protein
MGAGHESMLPPSIHIKVFCKIVTALAEMTVVDNQLEEANDIVSQFIQVWTAWTAQRV